MADITRDQFNEANLVRRKVFQKGRYLADADLNEQAQIFDNYDRRLLSSLVSFVDKRFGEGFKVVPHNNPLTVTVKAGYAAFHLADKSAVLLKLDNDYTLTGFATWTQERTDYIYLDIEEKEISPTEDIVIVNPAIGEETCRDIRLAYEIKISSGVAPADPPVGHIYRTIATITIILGSYIPENEITSTLPNFHIDLPTIPETLLWSQSSVNHEGDDAIHLEDESQQYFVESTIGSSEKRVIRVSFAHQTGARYLALRAKVWRDNAASDGYIRLDAYSYSWLIHAPKTPTYVTLYFPIMGEYDPGELQELNVVLVVAGANVKVYMERPAIFMGFGNYEYQSYAD
jgi:hypothetical protein